MLAESSGIEPHTTKWNNLFSKQFRHHVGLLSIKWRKLEESNPERFRSPGVQNRLPAYPAVASMNNFGAPSEIRTQTDEGLPVVPRVSANWTTGAIKKWWVTLESNQAAQRQWVYSPRRHLACYHPWWLPSDSNREHRVSKTRASSNCAREPKTYLCF